MAKVCDCFPELKEITEARERRYRTHPEKEAPEGPQSFVEVKVTSIGQLNELGKRFELKIYNNTNHTFTLYDETDSR